MRHRLHEEVSGLVEARKMAPASTKGPANKAVEIARALMGTGSRGSGAMYLRPRDEKKLRGRLDKLIKKIEGTRGVDLSYNQIHDQIWDQAKKLGGRMAMPGKDI